MHLLDEDYKCTLSHARLKIDRKRWAEAEGAMLARLSTRTAPDGRLLGLGGAPPVGCFGDCLRC
eukprot:15476860-Alexandrium_andersonii.AAC.1